MSLLLAIEPDRRQAAKLTAIARGPLNVELVVGDTTERAFHALGARVPDLVLTSQLLSPKDEASLADRLRELDAAGAHVQTLVIPVLGSAEGDPGEKKSGGLFGRLRGKASRGKAAEGCDPTVFGEQIAEYLERAAAERAALAAAQADLEAAWAEEPPPIASRYGEAESSWTPVVTTHHVTDVDAHASVESAPAAQGVDDPEALFGEFAAIPIPTIASAGRSDAAGRSPSVLSAEGEEGEAIGTFNLLERLGAPVADAPPVALREPVDAVRHDEDWEEISLEASTEGAPLDLSSAGAEDAAPSASEIVAESVDLAAFVRELETVPTSVHAEPLIPVVDLAAAMTEEQTAAVEAMPEPEPVFEPSPIPEAAQVFETVEAIPFDPAAATDAGNADAAFAELFATAQPAAAEPADGRFSAGTPVAEPPPAVATGLELADFEAALQLVNAPLEQAPGQAAAAAAEPSAAPHLTGEPESEPRHQEPPVVRAAWQDVLSAIRRDIGQLRIDDAPAPAERPSFDLANGPLVFPPRKPVAASVIEPLFKMASPPDAHPVVAEPAVTWAGAVVTTPADGSAAPVDGESTAAAAIEAETLDNLTIDAAPAADPVETFELAVTARPLPEPPADWQVEPADAEPARAWQPERRQAPEPAPGHEPVAPAPVLPVHVVDAPEPVVARPTGKSWPEPRKSTKSKKKRKQGRHHQPQPPVDAPASANREAADDWGFFDPEQVGFGALVGKLNEITGAGRARGATARW